jgi:hypothetical protein
VPGTAWHDVGVSIEVGVEQLFEQLGEWGPGYLLTGNEQAGRPHLLALRPSIVDGALRFDAGGGRACRNAAERPDVTVLFPPHAGSDGFSLVVDGEASVSGDIVDVRPTRALLRRPAP